MRHRAILPALAVLFLAAAGLAVAFTAPAARAATCIASGDTDSPADSCGPYDYPQSRGVSVSDEIEVDNNVWSDPAGFTNRTCTAGPRPCQTLYAASPGQWHVIADYPAGNTSVRSYPNTYQQVDWVNGREPKLASWRSAYSSWSETFRAHANKGTVAEAAYDIWLNNWDNEVMIQVDFAGDSLRPRCDVNGDVIATQKFGGTGGVPVQKWELCQFGDELIWQYATGTNHASGRVNVLAMLTWLETHGHGRYLPANSGLTAFSFGFEICSTGGVPETFPLTGFTLTAAKR
jgi:hypothetical protein